LKWFFYGSGSSVGVEQRKNVAGNCYSINRAAEKLQNILYSKESHVEVPNLLEYFLFAEPLKAKKSGSRCCKGCSDIRFTRFDIILKTL